MGRIGEAADHLLGLFELFFAHNPDFHWTRHFFQEFPETERFHSVLDWPGLNNEKIKVAFWASCACGPRPKKNDPSDSGAVLRHQFLGDRFGKRAIAFGNQVGSLSSNGQSSGSDAASPAASDFGDSLGDV